MLLLLNDINELSFLAAYICSMRKSSHLSLIFFSKLYTMTARKPPISSIKIQPLPFEGVSKAEEKHIVLQNNQHVSIKDSKMNCDLPVTTSQVVTGLPERAQVNTHLVSHASMSELLMKPESRLTTNSIKDEVQIEQNSSAEILISFHNYNELDQDRCPPPVSDTTDVLNPCNVQSPVDKERKTSKQTIIGNLQMSKHNSLLSNWQSKTKDNLVLTRDLLEKVTKVIRMVYINNETLIINQTIQQPDDSECNDYNTGTENDGGSKKSITLPAKTNRKSKKTSTTTHKPQKESKITKKKMTETKKEDTTNSLPPTSVVKPTEQNDNSKTRNRKTRLKVKNDSLQTEKGNQTLEQMKVTPVDRQNKVRSDKALTRKQSDTARPIKTQSDRKNKKTKSCDQPNIKVIHSDSNGENTMISEENNAQIKQKYHTNVRVTRKDNETSNNHKAEGIPESQNIEHKKKSRRKNKKKRDKNRESVDRLITNISTDVLLEKPSKEELALYNLSEMSTGKHVNIC